MIIALIFATLLCVAYAAVNITELSVTYSTCGASSPTLTGPKFLLQGKNYSYFSFELFTHPAHNGMTGVQFVAKDLTGTLQLLAKKIVVSQDMFQAMDEEQRQDLYRAHLPSESDFEFIDIVTGEAFPMFNWNRGLFIYSPLAYANVFIVRAAVNTTSTSTDSVSFVSAVLAGDNWFMCDFDKSIRNAIIIGMMNSIIYKHRFHNWWCSLVLPCLCLVLRLCSLLHHLQKQKTQPIRRFAYLCLVKQQKKISLKRGYISPIKFCQVMKFIIDIESFLHKARWLFCTRRDAIRGFCDFEIPCEQ